MDHNYVKDDNFCILTISRNKRGGYNVTGNSKMGIAPKDTINYIVNTNYDTLEVRSVIEQRDDKSFPKGNNLWFNVECDILKNQKQAK